MTQHSILEELSTREHELVNNALKRMLQSGRIDKDELSEIVSFLQYDSFSIIISDTLFP